MPTTVCPSANAVSVTANVIGGTASYTYAWTGATGSTANVSVTIPATCGNVNVKIDITDAKGCTATNDADITVADNVAPTGTAPAGTNNINACFVNATTMPVGVPAFNPTAAAAGYTDNCAGTVTATLTGTSVTGNNCSWTGTYTFKVSDACGNELTNQTIVYTGGDKTAPTGTAPSGTTNINACFVDASTMPLGVPAFATLNAATGYTDNCGGTVTATLTGTTVTGTNCSWTGTYTFKVSDACNNELTNQTIVYTGGDKSAPTFGLSGTTANPDEAGNCVFEVPDLESLVISKADNCTAAGSLIYTQTPPAGTVITADQVVSITLTDACGNVSAAQTVTVQYGNPNPTANITNITGTTILTCATTSISVTATGGGTYAWDNGLGSAAAATITNTGTYTVTVTAANGCTDTESITITDDKTKPTAGITPSGTELSCSVPSITLTPNGVGSYVWLDGTATITEPGDYRLEVTAANGCKDTATVTITKDNTPNTKLPLNKPASVCENAAFELPALTDADTYYEYSINGIDWLRLNDRMRSAADNHWYRVNSSLPCVHYSDSVKPDIVPPITGLILEYENISAQSHQDKEMVTPGQTVQVKLNMDNLGNYQWNDGKKDTTTVDNTLTIRLYKDRKITVVADNNGCPSEPAEIDIPVIWPTAITPYTKDGYNDDFIPEINCHIIIFNRYGQKVSEGNNGWDGTYRGALADPGTYMYVVNLPDGEVKKGTIEVVKIK
ncbi:MAG: gliding motility-associated C-terminal domain-containing protein [Prevotellaceae bacterium]|nr:gliding motility-associated C-terminal domain-containing protein [Prevotellaceae bacterium]